MDDRSARSSSRTAGISARGSSSSPISAIPPAARAGITVPDLIMSARTCSAPDTGTILATTRPRLVTVISSPAATSAMYRDAYYRSSRTPMTFTHPR